MQTRLSIANLNNVSLKKKLKPITQTAEESCILIFANGRTWPYNLPLIPLLNWYSNLTCILSIYIFFENWNILFAFFVYSLNCLHQFCQSSYLVLSQFLDLLSKDSDTHIMSCFLRLFFFSPLPIIYCILLFVCQSLNNKLVRHTGQQSSITINKYWISLKNISTLKIVYYKLKRIYIIYISQIQRVF